MNKLLKISTLFICTSLLFACSNEAKEVKGVADIVLRDKQVVLSVNETYQINPSYFVGNKRQSNITFAYQSLNNDVTTVSNTGLVTAIAVGEAIIQVTSKDCKTLFKVVVQEDESSALLALNLKDSFINLYKDDQFEFKYETRLNGQIIDLAATYYDYNSSIININNNVITALNTGSTNVNIKVTYNGLEAIETFTVAVLESKYYLSCNYEDRQLVVDNENITVTYSLNYKSNVIRTLSLSELNPQISDETIASISGNSIIGHKKGYFDLEVSYYDSQIGETITSVDSFRCRQLCDVNVAGLDEHIHVLDGEKIDYAPISSDPNLKFDYFLKDGVKFDEPVESDLKLGIKWKINEFNFAQNVRDAHSFAPTVGEDGETIEAVYYNDDDLFSNGLRYDLSKNCLDGNATEDIAANIYLPKMDYRKASKVSYYWKTNGYITIDMAHWYGGAMAMGGRINITYDGHYLTETIVQTYDIKDPFSGISYKNASRTIVLDDLNIIQGNESLQSLSYWAYKDIVATSSIYLSNPDVSISKTQLPYIRLGNFSGEVFSTDDPNAHYASDYTKPKVIQNVSDGNDSKEDYFYYYQDRQYDASRGWTHCRADYTLTLPIINFAEQDETIVVPYLVEGGFYLGFAENKYVTDCEGQMWFAYSQSDGLVVSLRSSNGELLYAYECTDTDVINGIKGFTFPTCYSTYCFQRGAMFYQPRYFEKCVEHNYVFSSETLGLKVCSRCGETMNYKVDFNDVDFTQATYGAQGGRWATNVQPTEKTMTFEVTAGNVENIISMPKINFNVFDNIVFNVSDNSWEGNVGLESGSYVFPSVYKQGGHHGTITFARNGNQINVTLACPEGSTQTKTITDEDIINGNKSLSLYMYSTIAYRTIIIELATLN